MKSLKKKLTKPNGFTVIEVMIVLAIAGLILLIVFLIVPSAQRAQRNTERRQIVAAVFADVQQYVNTYGKYPATAADYCRLYDMSTVKSDTLPCTINYSGADHCNLIEAGKYTVCFHDVYSPHDYDGPYDQINIQLAHWCAKDNSNPAEYPITDESTNDNTLSKYVVWTPLENGGFACTGSV